MLHSAADAAKTGDGLVVMGDLNILRTENE